MKPIAIILLLHLISVVSAQVDWMEGGGRSGHTVTPLSNGLMLAGGASSEAIVLADVWEMTGGTWSPLSGATTQLPPLYGHAMSGGSNGRVIVFGGSSAVRTPVVRADTWVWTGNNWTLIGTPLGLGPRWFHAMAFDAQRDEVLLFGGADAATVFGDTWILDLAQNPPVWRQHFGSVAPPARFGHTMAYDAARQKIVLVAGSSAFSGGGSLLGDHWEWDGSSWTSNNRTSGPRAWRPAMAYDPVRQRIVVNGGFDRPNQGGSTGAYATTHQWDGTSWDSRQNWNHPDPRGGGAAAFSATLGAVVLQGGAPENDGRNARTDSWKFDGSAWTLVAENLAPLHRQGAAMCFDTVRQHTVMFGGDGPVGTLGDTWTWDGQAWTSRAPAMAPTARWRSAMAFDSFVGRALLFGGSGSPTYLDDSWLWDGVTWQPHAYAGMEPRPAVRAGHAMAYDSTRREVVLFGGENVNGPRQDTWVWDGTVWASRSTSTAPPARRLHAMAFDAARGVVVLHGGYGATGTTLGDTWEWDGSVWRSAGSGPARYGHAMSSDSVRNRIVLFGGFGGTGDTQEWDGQRWSVRLPASHPAQRYYHSMAFDSARSRTVLFGGNASGLSSETWEMTANPVTASWSQQGPGCAGAIGSTSLDASELPWLGYPTTFTLTGAYNQLVVALGLGVGAPNLHLDLIGMPTCYLNTSWDIYIFMGFAGAGRYDTSPIPIPSDPGMIGAVLYLQCFLADFTTGARSLSNARRAVFAIR